MTKEPKEYNRKFNPFDILLYKYRIHVIINIKGKVIHPVKVNTKKKFESVTYKPSIHPNIITYTNNKTFRLNLFKTETIVCEIAKLKRPNIFMIF